MNSFFFYKLIYTCYVHSYLVIIVKKKSFTKKQCFNNIGNQCNQYSKYA